MPGYFSYIGRLDSPGFFWTDIPDAEFRSGNTPNRIIPAGFSLGLGFAPETITEWGKKQGFEGKQLDWGGWGMIMSKSNLETLWNTQKKGTDEKEWLGIWNEIEALPDGDKYVLVVAENIF
jgi:hypothetical protein